MERLSFEALKEKVFKTVEFSYSGEIEQVESPVVFAQLKDGKAKVTIFATGAGDTVIYAMSDSSVVAEISVEVKNKSYESYIVTVVGAIVGVSVIAALVIVSAVIVAVKKKVRENTEE